jgi:hypothetical protein
MCFMKKSLGEQPRGTVPLTGYYSLVKVLSNTNPRNNFLSCVGTIRVIIIKNLHYFPNALMPRHMCIYVYVRKDSYQASFISGGQVIIVEPGVWSTVVFCSWQRRQPTSGTWTWRELWTRHFICKVKVSFVHFVPNKTIDQTNFSWLCTQNYVYLFLTF